MSSRTKSGRRAFLRHGARAAGLFGLWLALGAHTPYRQWKVYRQRHLLILASKTDPEGYHLSQKVAAVLAEALPDSRARPSRAPGPARIASLLGTAQMDVALMPRTEAAALNAGMGRFADTGPVDLRALFSLGPHLLVCRAEFPEAHAYLIVKALDSDRAGLPGNADGVLGEGGQALAPHPGVLVYLKERGKAG